MTETQYIKDLLLNNSQEAIPIIRHESLGSIGESEKFIDDMYNLSMKEKSKRNFLHDIKSLLKVELDNLKDHCRGDSSDVVKILLEEVNFLREELRSKNMLINHLITQNITNTKLTQKDDNINVTINSTVPDIGAFDTPNLSSLQHNQTTECKINDQLSEVRKANHINYLKNKSNTKSYEENQTIKQQMHVHKHSNTCMVLSDSMFNGIHEKNIQEKTQHRIKVRYFSGAKIEDMRNQIEPLLTERKLKIVILHVGTNNAQSMASNEIVDGLLSLKSEIMKIHPCQVIISTPIVRTDNGKASYTIKRVNDHLRQLKIDIMDNSNITHKDLGKKGLHLSSGGKLKLIRNVVKELGNSKY